MDISRKLPNTTQENDWTWKPYISDQQVFPIKVSLLVIGCGVVCLFGIVSNLINIVVFLKQGAHKENGSVNLLGLAIADLIVVTIGLYMSVLFAILLLEPPNLTWVPMEVIILTAHWPHTISGQVTKLITTFIVFERCVCVVFPFKVKTIFKPTRSIFLVACAFFVTWLGYYTVFVDMRLKYTLNPVTNETLLRLVYSPNVLRNSRSASWAIHNTTVNVGSVAIIIICTVITVSRVKLSKTWRDAVSRGGASGPSDKSLSSSTSGPDCSKDGNAISSTKLSKEKRMVNMITLIAVVSLICYIPFFVILVSNMVNPEVKLVGKHKNLAWTLTGLGYFSTNINSSMNILIYYRLSSKYKKTFREIFNREQTKVTGVK